MKTSLLVLALSAAWALPSAAQEALLDPGPEAQFSARLDWNDTSVFKIDPYVIAIHGLVFPRMPDLNPRPIASSKWPAFSFMGAWDPSNPMNRLFPSGPNKGPTANSIDIRLNSANPNAANWAGYAIQLGGARMREWELFAENGIFVAESAKFTYTTKQTISLAKQQ